MTSILIADDHPIVVKGIQQTLYEEFGNITTDTASNTQEVIQKILTNDYDLVILDITMPGRSGIEAIKQIRAESPGLPILILSMHSEGQYPIQALRAGASGYVTKNRAPEELLTAVKKLMSGQKYISSDLTEILIFELNADADKPLHASLSDREYEVLCLIASGKTVTEVSKELFLSVKTISTYRTRILEKMNMRTNAELMHYAMHNQLTL